MSPATLMERLKEETWPMHQEAERQALEQDLVKGALSREMFREYLAQRFLVHRELEAALRRLRDSDPRAKAIVHDHQFHESRALEDFEFYGGNPADIAPLPATRQAIDAIAATEKSAPIALLGIQYVFEGSTNGARYIARAVRKAYDLQGAEGTRYLDPYGDEQRTRWQAFKEGVNAQQFTPDEEAAVIEAAKETFGYVTNVGREIYAGAASGGA